MGHRSLLQGAGPGMHVNRSLESVLVHTSRKVKRRIPNDRGAATGPWPSIDTNDWMRSKLS